MTFEGWNLSPFVSDDIARRSSLDDGRATFARDLDGSDRSDRPRRFKPTDRLTDGS